MTDLIDRETLIEELKKLRFPCILPSGIDYLEGVREAVKRYSRIVNEAPTVNRWIPCNERMPEIDVDVIVFYPSWDDKSIQVAHLNYDKLTFELSDGEFYFPASAVTHWMPRPEPPEKE